VSVPDIIQGRRIGTFELEQLRQLLGAHPDWSRWRLSRHLATLWNWRNRAGRIKDMAARTLLHKLQQRGWIVLPPLRPTPFHRLGPQSRPAAQALIVPESQMEALPALLPLTVTEVSSPAGASQRPVFAALLQQQHYLGYRRTVGENLQYLVSDRQGRCLACVLFGSAAWQCAARDEYVGWNAATRLEHLRLLTNNTRFLIPAWVRVPHLASHVLSLLARRLSRDWQSKYGHPIYLLETFVQTDRFAGSSYRAANWVCVGRTQGRSRQDSAAGTHQQVPIKDVYLYPLHPRFRELLQGHSTPPTHCTPNDPPCDSPAST